MCFEKKQNSEIFIKTVSIKDAAELLEIYRYYVENTAITFEVEVPSLQEFSARIEKTLKKYPYLKAVSAKTGEILGYSYAGEFKNRAAYDWAVETSIYVRKDLRKQGIGRLLLENLEKILKKQNILNVYACIGCTEKEDEYLTNASVRFHEKMNYRTIGRFENCGYKFDRWYSMIWMEKIVGEHKTPQKKILLFSELTLDN